MSNYVSMEELRRSSQLGDLPVDYEAQAALDAAEEAIEAYCGRKFWKDAADVTRYFQGQVSFVLIDDLATLTSLKTDDDGDGTFESTWASTDYVLAPYNAAADSRAYSRIELAPTGRFRFPTWARGVQVIGKFGWPAVPARVAQATMIQATRFLKRARSAPFGIETITVEGAPVRLRSRLDPDVEVMLSRLRKAT